MSHYTHRLMATWTPEAKRAGITYGRDAWPVDLSSCRLRLEREANRRNADDDYYPWSRYYVEAIR